MNIAFQPIPVDIDDEKVDGRLVMADAHLVAVLVMLPPSHDELAGKWFAEALLGALGEEGHPVFKDLDEALAWFDSKLQASRGGASSSVRSN